MSWVSRGCRDEVGPVAAAAAAAAVVVAVFYPGT